MVHISSITVCSLIHKQFKTPYTTTKSNKAIYIAVYIHYKLYYIISYLPPIILWRTHSDNIQSHHHKSRNKDNTVNKVINIELHTITNYTTSYHTYSLLYYEGHIRIIYNPNIIKVQTKKYSNKVINIELHTITNCSTLYQTYHLLYYEVHIKITYNPTIIKVQTKRIQ